MVRTSAADAQEVPQRASAATVAPARVRENGPTAATSAAANPVAPATVMPEAVALGTATPDLISSAAYTAACNFAPITGLNMVIRCNDSRIQPNSRVFVSLSEYDNDPLTGRHMGDLITTVHNVVPSNGFVLVRVDIDWPNPKNIRMDLLVDP